MKKRQGLLAVEFALLGVLVGLGAGVVLAWPAVPATNSVAYSQPAAATAPRTAYVDFIKLLRSDPTFLTSQWQTMTRLESDMSEEAEAFDAQRKDDQKRLAKLSADSMEYRDLMKEIIKSSADSNKKRLTLESDAQRTIDEYAQENFKRIKNIVAEISKQKGYTEVLVISTTPAKNLKFEELQKQLLLSPVLIYPEEDDITKVVEKEVMRRGHGFLEIGDQKAKEGTIENDGIWIKDEKGAKVQRIAADKAKNPDDIWFEVKLGAKVQFECAVTDLDEAEKRIPAAPDNAAADWSLPKLASGEIDEKTGVYKAPAVMPIGGAIIAIRVSCKKTLSIFKTIRVRLLP